MIIGLCALGFLINALLLAVLWNGMTSVASNTVLIIVLYTAVISIEARGG